MKPLLSIITINYNNLTGLQRTLQSVWSQSWQQFEYIVIDGGSNDGSREFLEAHNDKVDYWVSEKDAGIFNAQNKGWQKSSGEYLLFLNSGDGLFADDTLAEMISELDGTGIIYGNLLKEEPGKEWVKQYNKPLSLHYFYWETLPHQGAFIKKSLLDEQNGYDENLRLAGDWKFFLNAVCKFGASTKYLDKTIALYNLEGLTAQTSNQQKLRTERENVWLSEWPMQYKTVLALMDQMETNKSLRSRMNKMADSVIYRIYSKLRSLIK